KGGNPTKDRIFLLTADEVQQYIPDKEARKCMSTYFAEPEYYNAYNYWWLRSVGKNNACAAVVISSGEVYDSKYSIHGKAGVRPVFWLDLSGLGKAEEPAQPTGTPAAAPAPVLPDVGLKAGGSFTFGRYEQDENAGADPIEWQVLAVEDGRALLLSKYGLDARNFNDINENITWGSSTLRKWLNEDFYNTAFSGTEQNLIVQVTNQNPRNESYKVRGEDPTTDRIFLLNVSEAARYFPDKENGACEATAYARAHGAKEGDNYFEGAWWLRSLSENYNYQASVVDTREKTYRFTFAASYHCIPVRPAFWLDLQNLPVPAESEQPTAVPAPKASGTDMQPGGSFTFGSYEQDENAGADPIEWQVLAVEDGRALLLSKYGLDAGVYNEKREDVAWENSSIRQWLNSEFFEAAFSSEEKSRIPENGAQGRIFLLSTDEIERYFKTEASRQCQATGYARQNGAKANKNSGFSWWWLRLENTGSSAPSVGSDGKISTSGHYVDTAGVLRPAFWLNL
ncbi:MAG: hypothetical protein IKP86_02760, partial [Anaerolineaceae bacterium]|nr:hypothetical protein [Anaerolineaceae bacterium]